MTQFTFGRAVGGVAGLMLSTAAFASPFASAVTSYVPGVGAPAGYQDSTVALGEPTRYTGQTLGFPGSVTPFAAAFEGDEIVAIGRGGSLVLQFDQPVVNDPLNPYGIDLLIFGNTFYYADDFSPIAQNLWQPAGVVEVSQDGVSWMTIPNVQADGLFPTLGYADEVNPFGGDAGLVPTDFTKPVDPNFAWQGLGLAGIIAGYNGSGGGAGVDLSSVNMPSISYVRLSLPANATVSKIEIDAVSDVTAVPSPGVVAVLAFAGAISGRRRRGGYRVVATALRHA